MGFAPSRYKTVVVELVWLDAEPNSYRGRSSRGGLGIYLSFGGFIMFFFYHYSMLLYGNQIRNAFMQGC